jgi:hypothetical protein
MYQDHLGLDSRPQGAGAQEALSPAPAAAAAPAAQQRRPSSATSCDDEDHFLCITVREARNLAVRNKETGSSDP